MLALLTVTVLLQGAEVTASVDKTHLTVGEELVLTVRARSRSTDAVEIILPTLNGFAVVGSRDMTEVAFSGAGGSGGSIRTTVRELQLRAQQPGALLIGPVRARQGQSVVATDPILITVDSAANQIAVALSPLARALLETTPAPLSRRADRVALTMLVPSDTVYAGQQVDLIAAAWIPRELRERMRRSPLLTLITPEGVWAYPPAPSSGVALTRQVGGRWLDLFITHQIVFPLAAGRLIIPPASVEYALPVTFSFFSREERYALRSDSITVTVLPLPQSADNPGTSVVGQGLKLAVHLDPASTRSGEPVEAAVTVDGVGNVALWPEPKVRWPAGFRAYPAQTEVRVAPQGGRIAGNKIFRFLAVPDSAGNFTLPEVRYPYFDPATGRFEMARSTPQTLAVAPGAEPRAARLLPALMPRRGELPADRLARELAWEGWLGVLLLPPVVAGLARRRRRRTAAPSAEPPGAHELTHLGRLEREFLVVLASHVSDPFARDGDGLAQALRAAGVDSAVADHVKRLRDRLRAASILVIGVGFAGAGHVAAVGGPDQSPSAEALYEAGALRVAADSFSARAAREPRDPAHWFNLGATLYRAGADGKATAAWTVAARLAPRDASIRRALALLPPPDLMTEELLRVGWATPGEWIVVAAAAWVMLWFTVAVGSRRRIVLAAFAAVTLAAISFGAIEQQRRDQPAAVVVTEAAPVRTAPYGGASAAATVQAGGALLVIGSYGPWREVRRKDGIHGWVLNTEIAAL